MSRHQALGTETTLRHRATVKDNVATQVSDYRVKYDEIIRGFLGGSPNMSTCWSKSGMDTRQVIDVRIRS